MNAVDPDGRDYWTTDDPDEIARFLNALKSRKTTYESFEYSDWDHTTDAEFTGNLTYNDITKTFYSSYGTVVNGNIIINGISLKAMQASEYQSDIMVLKPTPGNIEQDNILFDLLSGKFVRGLGIKALKGIFYPEGISSTVKSFGIKSGKQSSKRMPHGDNGRALKKIEGRVKELKEQMKTSTVKEKKRIQEKIDNLIKNAQKKEKGETHWH